MPKFQFEYEKFNVCGDCPCWTPDYIEKTWASSVGKCDIDLENRNRFDDRPEDCPLQEV